MGRRLKLRNKEAYYHVTVRTAQKMPLLARERVKLVWENKLSQLSQAYYVDVYAHAVLSNHVHLVLKVNRPEKDAVDLQRRFEYLESTLVSRRKWKDHMEDEVYRRFTDLSRFMRDLSQWTGAWYNNYGVESQKTSGHFWGRRFFSKVVGDDQYLLTVMSYVDLNPVRAGLVRNPRDFKYCTAGKLRQRLEDGESVKFPAVGWLARIDPRKRAQAYLAWLDFLVFCDGKVKMPKSFNAFSWAIRTEGIDIEKIRLQIINKEPSNWSVPVFANENFVKAVLACQWLQPETRRALGEPLDACEANDLVQHRKSRALV